MMSNIELLKIELIKRKQGNIQQTINELAVEFNRNGKNLSADFKVLGQTGFIEVGIGIWKYKAKELEAIITELDQTSDDLLNDRAVEQSKAKKVNARDLYEGNRDRLKVLKKIILDLQTETKSSVPLKDIIKRAVEYGIREDLVDDLMNRLKSSGDLIENSSEKFRIV